MIEKKGNQKKMKEYDKRKSHINSKHLLIMLDTLLLRPSLHFTQLHFTTLSLALTPF